MGAIRGAQLADYFINGTFGAPTLFMVIFLLVAGLKMMHVVKVRLWKWFIGCSLLMVWCSVFLAFMFQSFYLDSFFYLGGLHGYNVSNWLESQVGVPGVLMILFFTAICLLVYLSTQTVIWLRKILSFGYLKRKKKDNIEEEDEEEAVAEDVPTEEEPQTDPMDDSEEAFADDETDQIKVGDPDNFYTLPASKDPTEAAARDLAADLRAELARRGLALNPEKEALTGPAEGWTFLGFYCRGRTVDVAPATAAKLKAKMRRKARALQRWKQRSGAGGERAAAAFIRVFNRKLLDSPAGSELSWKHWFFPVINTADTLWEIDRYAQDCIRFLVSGKRTKARFSVRYEDLKALGYRSLVHDYYAHGEEEREAARAGGTGGA